MNKKLKYIAAFSVVVSQFACVGVSVADAESAVVENHMFINTLQKYWRVQN